MTQIKNEEDVDPFTRVALQDFSYSRLNTYQGCELRYFYSYILKEQQDFGPPALLGNVIHKALEITLENGQEIDLKELMENYRLATKDLDPAETISSTMIDEGAEMLLAYKKDHPGEIDLYEKELPFTFVLGPARFNGFIDFVSVSDTLVSIRDYKSGRKEITYAEIPTNLQLAIYALYMKKLFPDKTIHAELYYLRKGKARGHTFTDDDLLAAEQTLLKLVSEVLTKENFVATDNERECNWCDFAKNGTCSTGELRLNRRAHSKW